MVQGRYDQLSADILTQREQERLAQRLEKLNKVTVPATTTTSTWVPTQSTAPVNVLAMPASNIAPVQQPVYATVTATSSTGLPVTTPMTGTYAIVESAPVTPASGYEAVAPLSPSKKESWFDRHFHKHPSETAGPVVNKKEAKMHAKEEKQVAKEHVKEEKLAEKDEKQYAKDIKKAHDKEIKDANKPGVRIMPPSPALAYSGVSATSVPYAPVAAAATAVPSNIGTAPSIGQQIPVNIVQSTGAVSSGSTGAVAAQQPMTLSLVPVSMLPVSGISSNIKVDESQFQRYKATEQQLIDIQKERSILQSKVMEQQQILQQQLLNKDNLQLSLEHDLVEQQKQLQNLLLAKEQEYIGLRTQLEYQQSTLQMQLDTFSKEKLALQDQLARKNEQTNQLESDFANKQSKLQQQLNLKDGEFIRLQQQLQVKEREYQGLSFQLQQQQASIQEQLKAKEAQLAQIQAQRVQYQTEQMKQIGVLQEQLRNKDTMQRQLEIELQQQRVKLEQVVRQKEAEMRQLEIQFQGQRNQQQQLLQEHEAQQHKLQDLLQRKDQREHQLEFELQKQQDFLKYQLGLKEKELKSFSSSLQQKEYELEQMRVELQKQQVIFDEKINKQKAFGDWSMQQPTWKRDYYYHNIHDVIPFQWEVYVQGLGKLNNLFVYNTEFKSMLYEFNTLLRQTLSANLMFSSIPSQAVDPAAQKIKGFNEKAFMRIFDYELDDQSRKLLAVQWQDFFRRLYSTEDVLDGFKTLFFAFDLMGNNDMIDELQQKEVWKCIQSIEGQMGVNFHKFYESLIDINHRAKDDVHFWEELEILKFYVWHSLNDFEWVESAEFTDCTLAMIIRFRLLAHRHGQTVSRALLKFNFVLEKFRNKSFTAPVATQQFQQNVAYEPRDIFYYDQGRPTLKPDFLEQFRTLLLPTVIDNLKCLKTPRVIGSDETLDYEIDNIIFCGSNVSADNVRIDTLALENVDVTVNVVDQHATIAITFNNVIAKIDDVKFAYRRKQVAQEDRGYMEISLYGNACIELELKPCSTMGKRLFNVQRVRCDASKICFLSARNDLNGLSQNFKPIIEMKVHRAIEQAVEDIFCKIVEQVDTVLINDYKWQISSNTMEKLENYEQNTLYGKGGITQGTRYGFGGGASSSTSVPVNYGNENF